MQKHHKPWEDEDGNLLPTATLKIVSRDWPKRTWEAYLKTLEHSQTEALLANYDRILLKRDAQNAIRDYQAEEACDERESLYLSPANIRKALIHLNYRQRRLVELVYLHEMTIKEAAKKLGLSPQPAGRTLKRARQRMEEELTNRIEAHANAPRTIQLQ